MDLEDETVIEFKKMQEKGRDRERKRYLYRKRENRGQRGGGARGKV